MWDFYGLEEKRKKIPFHLNLVSSTRSYFKKGPGKRRSCKYGARDWHMFKSYVSKVWLSMKFRFIKRCPWERRDGMPRTCQSDSSQALRRTLGQLGCWLCSPKTLRFSSEWEWCIPLPEPSRRGSRKFCSPPQSSAPAPADLMARSWVPSFVSALTLGSPLLSDSFTQISTGAFPKLCQFLSHFSEKLDYISHTAQSWGTSGCFVECSTTTHGGSVWLDSLHMMWGRISRTGQLP